MKINGMELKGNIYVVIIPCIQQDAKICPNSSNYFIAGKMKTLIINQPQGLTPWLIVTAATGAIDLVRVHFGETLKYCGHLATLGISCRHQLIAASLYQTFCNSPGHGINCPSRYRGRIPEPGEICPC